MTADSRSVRLFVDCRLTAGAAIELSTDQAHYLRNVMRRSTGEGVALFNGRDGEWHARIESLGKRAVAAIAESQVRAQAFEGDPWLVFAPVKGGRVETIVEKATELGASRLVPVLSARTVVSRVNPRRLRARAIEAAEQCGRLSVPDIAEAVALDALLDSWPSDRQLFWCDESRIGAPIAEAMERHVPDKWAVMTGPEGGYAPSELDAIRKLPFVTPISLGERILRADTAAIAALACVQALIGDWRPAPSDAG